jgi:hypothetical protein
MRWGNSAVGKPEGQKKLADKEAWGQDIKMDP